jgi:hypothetical protein
MYQRKCKNGKKGSFSSRLASNEITTRGYRALTFVKCTSVMIDMLTVQAVCDPLSTRWYGLEEKGMALV